MTYDLNKYKDKREKVLGIKKRSISFGTIAAIVALCIVVGTGAVAVPKTVAYFSTRNLDDAIYKMAGSKSWDPEVIRALAEMHGVKNAVIDSNNTRLVVTYNRLHLGPKEIGALFESKVVDADLLNTVNHRNRMNILEKEAEFEAL